MSDTLDPLIRDFLEWIEARPRPYGEVVDAWRTSCPRLTVWEDASDRGLVERRHVAGAALRFELTAQGRRFLADCAAASPRAVAGERLRT